MLRRPAQLGLGFSQKNTPASLGVVTRDEGRQLIFKRLCSSQKNSMRIKGLTWNLMVGWRKKKGNFDVHKPKTLEFEFGVFESMEIHTNLELQVVGDGKAWLQAMSETS
ncbi:hypothetical protein EV1_031730 [Malus domestica]